MSGFALGQYVPGLMLLREGLVAELCGMPLGVPVRAVPAVTVEAASVVALLRLLTYDVFIRVGGAIPVPVTVGVNGGGIARRGPFGRRLGLGLAPLELIVGT